MAYTPSEWSCGDIVTADKLNNIEGGIAEVNSEYVPTSWQCGDLITAEAMNKIEQGIANAGGGSSDYTTAEVTVNISYPAYEALPDEYATIILQLAQLSNLGCTVPNRQAVLSTSGGNTSFTITPVLYRGVAIGIIDADWGNSQLSIETVTCSGDVSGDSQRIEITGDGVINIVIAETPPK